MEIIKQLVPGLTIKIEGEKQTELWEAMASAHEVFGEFKCGKCGSKNLRPIVRTNDDEDKFYELMCLACKAKLAMGVHKKGGTMFPKRRDNDSGDVTGEPKGYLPDRGWLRWDPETKKQI